MGCSLLIKEMDFIFKVRVLPLPSLSFHLHSPQFPPHCHFTPPHENLFYSGTSSDEWTDAFFNEINQDSFGMRVHIENFEVVQAPTSVVYGYTLAAPTCTEGPPSSSASVVSSFFAHAKELLL